MTPQLKLPEVQNNDPFLFEIFTSELNVSVHDTVEMMSILRK